jgi:hypothetical protein
MNSTVDDTEAELTLMLTLMLTLIAAALVGG